MAPGSMRADAHAPAAHAHGPMYTSLCIAAYGGSFLVFGISVNILGPTIKELAAQTGTSEPDLGGILFTLTGAASSLMAIPSGWLVDALPGHMVLALSMAAQAVGYAFVPSCSSFTSLMILFALVASTWNTVNTAANTLILWLASDMGGSGGTLVNFLHAVFGAGSLCAPLLANQSLRFFGSSVASYYMASAITAVSAASFLLLPSPRRPNRNGIGGGEGGGVGGEGGMPGDPEEQQQPGTSKATAGQLAWGQGRMWAILLPLVCLVFCAVGSEVAFGGWIATYSEKWAGASLQDAQLLNAGYWGAFTAGRVIASLVAHKLHPATILFFSMPLGLAGVALALFTPASALHGPAAWANVVLVGLGLSAAFANVLSLLDTYAPISGWVTGLLGGMGSASCMGFPLLVAMLAKHTPLGFQGLQWTMGASILIQLACLVLAVWAGRCALQRAGGAAAGVAAPERQPLLETGEFEE